MRPWGKRSEELEDAEGAYSDFLAWEEWAKEHDKECVLSNIDSVDMCFVYALFCKAADGVNHEPV